jgi:hypothetical protein
MDRRRRRHDRPNRFGKPEGNGSCGSFNAKFREATLDGGIY